MTTVPDEPDVETLATELEAARDERERVESRIERYGEQAVEAVDDAVDEALTLLARYEDSATGTGDFEAYLELQSRFVELVESLPAELPEREQFEEANEALDQRTISESDVEHAREALSVAGEVAALLDEREAAQQRVDDAEHAITERLNAIEERLEELDRLRELSEVDLSAPTERLTEPIERYNSAVRAAFEEYLTAAPARELLGVVRTTRHFPLAAFAQPPDELVAYVENHSAGEEPVPTLLKYAGFSQSKLDHYVEDTTAFRTTVPVHRTYLDRLGPEPLTVGNPPPTADELRHRSAELVSIVGRFADEETVALARELGSLTRRDDYERLREAAVAEEELSADQREALRTGAHEEEYERRSEERERLAELLYQ
jgi:hypothetical protein